jgi:DNA polymerase
VTDAERRAALEAIATEVRACTRCRLHRSRTNAVPGEGSPETEVVFVGEGPGLNEDQQGRPFVGAAGSLLNDLLDFVGWRREDVFIANVVKCRPPGNRDPEADEIAACGPFLRRQLEALDPAVVVTLGRHSLGAFQPGARISAAHGTARPVDPASGARNAVVYAMYHPAAAFRQAALRETLFAEMANLPQVLIDARAARDARAGDARPELVREASSGGAAANDATIEDSALDESGEIQAVADALGKAQTLGVAETPHMPLSPSDSARGVDGPDADQMTLF